MTWNLAPQVACICAICSRLCFVLLAIYASKQHTNTTQWHTRQDLLFTISSHSFDTLPLLFQGVWIIVVNRPSTFQLNIHTTFVWRHNKYLNWVTSLWHRVLSHVYKQSNIVLSYSVRVYRNIEVIQLIYLFIPKLQRLHRCSLGMNKQINK